MNDDIKNNDNFVDQDDDDEFIAKSDIGTLKYWENFYEEELENFENFGDNGETWFGIGNSRKIIEWINLNVSKDAYICDIGCGNGYILKELAKKHFKNLYGIDYSPKAIEFCKISTKSDECLSKIQFKVVDILADDNDDDRQSSTITNDGKKFDLIIDKGTYDAICLIPNEDINLNRRKYLEFLDKNLNDNDDGYFILFSCNFTKDEIQKFLLNKNSNNKNLNNINLQLIHEFETPKFSFGGKIGKQVTGLIFKKFN